MWFYVIVLILQLKKIENFNNMVSPDLVLVRNGDAPKVKSPITITMLDLVRFYACS